ncbi:UNVERIFIED_CONTAM: hypothetical protein HDU68_002251 [Siphonaria sp. JEL0065]|nr:hypothetical protein HDU68_002251 [Siphonaria sp. JEL0065]
MAVGVGDPLIQQLLGGGRPRKTKAVTSIQPPDHTKVIQIQRLKRLLLVMLNWWYPLRQWLPNGGKLPVVLDDAFRSEIVKASQSSSVYEMILVGTKIVDTLEREGGFTAAAA